MTGHHPTVTTTAAGAQATCSCGWRSPVRRVVRGWMAGALQINAAYAQADHTAHTAHALEEIAHAS